jgi:hypothetical protein
MDQKKRQRNRFAAGLSLGKLKGRGGGGGNGKQGRRCNLCQHIQALQQLRTAKLGNEKHVGEQAGTKDGRKENALPFLHQRRRRGRRWWW